MRHLFIASVFVLISKLGIAQCAFDYIDNYAARRCNDPDTELLYNVIIEPVTFSRIAISNFDGIENQDMFGNEEVIYADLNCSGLSLILEPTTVHLSVVPASLYYSGSGTLFPDSIRIFYTAINPDGEQDFCITYVRGLSVQVPSNDQQVNARLSLWPNPAASVLNLRIISGRVSDVKLFDTWGRSCYRGGPEVKEIDVTAFSPGLYFLQVKQTDGIIHTEKVLIQ